MQTKLPLKPPAHPKLTKNGIEQILETYDFLHEKDLGEKSSYMRINPNKDADGEETVTLRVSAAP